MTRAELVARVAKRTGASQLMTANTIESSLAEILDVLRRGDSISFSGFGSFDVYRRARRMGRHPRTGGEITIPAQNVPRFRAGKVLRTLVNGSN
jgi:DNA-binding protein HU-beta